MPDLSAENPIQPEQKKPSVAERVKGRLAEFWQRVGPESVIQDRMKTFQAIHEALGPGKAQDVVKLLDPVLKAGATVAGIGVTAGEITLGAITNSIVRRFTNWIPNFSGILVGLPVGMTAGLVGGDEIMQSATRGGFRVGLSAGEVIRTPLGVAAGARVAEIGVVHKVAGALEKHALRPLGVRVAEAVGNITRGWGQKTEPAPKPVG